MPWPPLVTTTSSPRVRARRRNVMTSAARVTSVTAGRAPTGDRWDVLAESRSVGELSGDRERIRDVVTPLERMRVRIAGRQVVGVHDRDVLAGPVVGRKHVRQEHGARLISIDPET